MSLFGFDRRSNAGDADASAHCGAAERDAMANAVARDTACRTSLEACQASVECARESFEHAQLVARGAATGRDLAAFAYATDASPKKEAAMTAAVEASRAADADLASKREALQAAEVALDAALRAATEAAADLERMRNKQTERVLRDRLRDAASVETFHKNIAPHAKRILELRADLQREAAAIDAAHVASLDASAKLRSMGEVCADVQAAHLAAPFIAASIDEDHTRVGAMVDSLTNLVEPFGVRTDITATGKPSQPAGMVMQTVVQSMEPLNALLDAKRFRPPTPEPRARAARKVLAALLYEREHVARSVIHSGHIDRLKPDAAAAAVALESGAAPDLHIRQTHARERRRQQNRLAFANFDALTTAMGGRSLRDEYWTEADEQLDPAWTMQFLRAWTWCGRHWRAEELMPVNLADVDEFTSPVVVPADADRADQTYVVTAAQALANRTQTSKTTAARQRRS